MHPRNPYKHPPDFSALAEYFPPLKPFVSLSAAGKPSINFQDPNAQKLKTLTQALLKRDFNITLSLPENRLCPTLRGILNQGPKSVGKVSEHTFTPRLKPVIRLNYILWIQDVLCPFDDFDSNSHIRGLDIGTGASAIYPLLGCSIPPSNQRWSFVGTEIDSQSASFASINVKDNNLSSRIKIWPISPSSLPKTDTGQGLGTILAPLIEEQESTYDFTMCNPPFYGSASEIESSAEGKEFPPNAVCTGAETEMITPGGETNFVLRMVRESARGDVKQRCRWFTSMLGKLNSVGTVVEELRKLEVYNYALTQFVQGTTRRWAVGWSFGDERLPDAIARPASSSLSSYLPAPTTLQQSFTIPSALHNRSDPTRAPDDAIRSTLCQVLTSINRLTFHECDSAGRGGMWAFDVQATENTWSRAARRKRKQSRSPSVGRVGKAPRLASSTAATTDPVSTRTPSRLQDPLSTSRAALHCHIKRLDPSSHQPLGTSPVGASSVTLEIQWVRGIDRKLFEGFWSHVCRKVRDNVA